MIKSYIDIENKKQNTLYIFHRAYMLIVDPRNRKSLFGKVPEKIS